MIDTNIMIIDKHYARVMGNFTVYILQHQHPCTSHIRSQYILDRCQVEYERLITSWDVPGGVPHWSNLQCLLIFHFCMLLPQ